MANKRVLRQPNKGQGGTVELDVSEPVIFVSVRSNNSVKRGRMLHSSSSLEQGGLKSGELSQRVVKLDVTARSKRATKVEITFWNEDLALSKTAVTKKGSLLVIQWGYSGYLTRRRVFRVAKIKGSRARVKALGQLTIIAYGQSMDFNNKHKSKTWRNIEVNDIARKIARSYGISDRDMMIDPSQRIKIKTAYQTNQTDAQFLIALSHKLGWVFAMEDGIFKFAPHPFIDECKPIGFYTYFTDDIGWIRNFTPESDLLSSPGSVTVKGRDPRTRKTVSYTATARTSKMKSMGKFVDQVPVNKRTNGRFTHREKTVSRPGVLPSNKVINKPSATATQAKREAEARMQNALHKGNKAKVLLIGDPPIWKDTTIRLDNVGEGFSGIWRVAEARHVIDHNGYDLDLKVTRNAKNKLTGNQKPSLSQKTKAQFAGRRTSGTVRGVTQTTNASTQGTRKRTRYRKR